MGRRRNGASGLRRPAGCQPIPQTREQIAFSSLERLFAFLQDQTTTATPDDSGSSTAVVDDDTSSPSSSEGESSTGPAPELEVTPEVFTYPNQPMDSATANFNPFMGEIDALAMAEDGRIFYAGRAVCFAGQQQFTQWTHPTTGLGCGPIHVYDPRGAGSIDQNPSRITKVADDEFEVEIASGVRVRVIKSTVTAIVTAAPARAND